MSHTTITTSTGTNARTPGVTRLAAIRRRAEDGATTAEYAVCTGAGVGFAGLLYRFITSEAGQGLLSGVFNKVIGLLPF